ncbi:MAG: 2-oxoglutarate dehydrogenase complex dihydrolipoyllysine-residue succinyltransferase [Burkholderiales bacterium]|nr:2-oxoglutarate dehydrogenase complex dihydrolipoyllysine-residue succinyltransferase [Burkholderiales bacterium]
MKLEIKVPQLPESVSEATLLGWHKQQGDFVKRDENLIDLETDKVVLELPCPEDGGLVEIIAKPGEVVKSGQIIAYLDTEVVGNNEKSASNSQPEPINSTKTATDNNKVISTKTETLAMPAAKKIAADNGIEIGSVSGSGRGGRILKEDVLNTIHNNKSSRIEERVAMSRLRKRVAERLIESQQTNAILTTFNEVNMQPVMNLRNQYKEKFEKKHGVKLGFMSFFVKAVVHALKQYPVVNASIDGDDIVYHGYFDFGIAVGSPRGLVVPIMRNVENMTIADIELKISDFGQRAKDGKIELEELTGGTFTITNGGTFGSMMSTPIINPPQSAILGMHAIKERVIVENGQMVIRPMMYLALSYDHRIIDGREAVLSLVAIKDAVEDPQRLLLDI